MNIQNFEIPEVVWKTIAWVALALAFYATICITFALPPYPYWFYFDAISAVIFTLSGVYFLWRYMTSNTILAIVLAVIMWIVASALLGVLKDHNAFSELHLAFLDIALITLFLNGSVYAWLNSQKAIQK